MKVVELIQGLLGKLTREELIIIAYQALEKVKLAETESSLDISPAKAKQLAEEANAKIDAMIQGEIEGVKGEDLKKWIHARISGNH